VSVKVAILIAELLREGGGERQALYLAHELQDMGHRVTVFTLAHDPQQCYPEVSSQLDIVTSGRHRLGRLPLPGRIRSYLDMGHLARQIADGFDVLNPHAWPAHWAAVEAARRLAHRPAVVWMCNDYLWPQELFRQPWNPVRLPRHVYSVLTRRYDQHLARRIDGLVVLDEKMAAKVHRGYDIKPLVVRSGAEVHGLAHPQSSASERVRLRYQIPAGRLLLLFVGILMPHRRLEDLLDALHQLAAQGRLAHLLVVGSLDYDRACARRLVALTGSLGLEDRVTFAGSVGEVDLPLYYSACDAFVFPNEDQTWGLAVTEAMAGRKPVIVSTGCGVAEVLTHEENALLVPPRRPDLLALQIRRLMDDRGLAEAIADAGYELVSRTLSWRCYAENMVRVFESASGKVAARQPGRSTLAAGAAPSHPGEP
jgi:glycosyltransferase involved in cell wall biosynthesis